MPVGTAWESGRGWRGRRQNWIKPIRGDKTAHEAGTLLEVDLARKKLGPLDLLVGPWILDWILTMCELDHRGPKCGCAMEIPSCKPISRLC